MRPSSPQLLLNSISKALSVAPLVFFSFFPDFVPLLPARHAKAASVSGASPACNDFHQYACLGTQASIETLERDRQSLKGFVYDNLLVQGPIDDFRGSFKKLFHGGEDLPFERLNLYFGWAEEKALSSAAEKREVMRTEATEVLETLRRAVQANSVLDASTKQNMLSSLSDMRILFATEFLAAYPKSASKWLFRGCLQEGLGPYGFQLTLTRASTAKETRMTVLCPGLVAVWKKFPSYVRWILGHEYGHFIDQEAFPQAYKSLRACSMGFDLNFPYFRGDTSPNACMEEISADFWANQVTVRMAADKIFPLTALRDTFVGFCGKGGSRIHPSEYFRAQQLGNDPKLRELLGCTGKPRRGQPACGL